MTEITETIPAADGTPLFRRTWTPEGPPKAVVHLSHGMAEHSGRYARLAEALTAKGAIVYAHDHRGHGHTATEDQLGHLGPDGFHRAVADLRDLLLAEKKAHEGLPLIAFGHSMGSYFTQAVLLDLSRVVSGAVLSGSGGKPSLLASAGRAVARAERARLGPYGKSPILWDLSFGAFNKAYAPTRTEADWLSRDEAEVDAYIADPLSGFPVTTDTWVHFLDGLAWIADPARQRRIDPTLPVYIVSGTDDQANERAAGAHRLVAAYTRAGLLNVTTRFVIGARHEVYFETNRDELTRELLLWLRRFGL